MKCEHLLLFKYKQHLTTSPFKLIAKKMLLFLHFKYNLYHYWHLTYPQKRLLFLHFKYNLYHYWHLTYHKKCCYIYILNRIVIIWKINAAIFTWCKASVTICIILYYFILIFIADTQAMVKHSQNHTVLSYVLLYMWLYTVYRMLVKFFFFFVLHNCFIVYIYHI